MRPPSGFCFIADDLSGALEVGGLWHEQGQAVRLVIDPENGPKPHPGQITGYDLNTRQQTEAAAVQTIRDQLGLILSTRQKLIYKKIDSTLRGWIRTEIQAVLDAGWPGVVFFCPANPAVGRTVADGLLLVDGVPVHRTALSRDPAFPVTNARITALFEKGQGKRAVHCPLSVIRQPGDGFNSWVDERIRSGARLLCFDATTDLDLRKIAHCAESTSGDTLLCGSGALASAMGPLGTASVEPARAELPDQSSGAKPTVAFLLGSAHPVTKSQFAALEHSREIQAIYFDPMNPAKWPADRDTINRQLNLRPVAIIPASVERSADRSNASKAIQDFYRQWSPTMDPESCGRLFVTGGETARTVIEAHGIAELELCGNLEPGVAVTRTTDAGPNLTVVTKPGGYGKDNTLIACYDFLTR